MIRTQIQITAEQAVRLRALSVELRQPIAKLIRTSIDLFLQKDSGISRERRLARAKGAVGRFASSHRDVSAKHDRYVSESFKGQ